MGHYSIKDLERLSGIKAHTIRIWEKRYGVIEPLRSKTNIRSYSDEDLKKIINIGILNQNGVKISRIANLSMEELSEKVIHISTKENESDIFIDRFIISMIDLNELKFESVLQEAVIKLGFEKTVVQVLYPFLRKIGVLWQTGNITPAHEHFISNLIRRKLFVAIDSIDLDFDKEVKTAILFLPETELHEIALLFYSYITKKNNIHPVYLGQSVPKEDLIKVNKEYKADFFITVCTVTGVDGTVEELLNFYSKNLADKPLFIAGLNENNPGFALPSGVHPFNNSDDLKNLFNIFS